MSEAETNEKIRKPAITPKRLTISVIIFILFMLIWSFFSAQYYHPGCDKWAEGKAMIGTIGAAIRTYAMENKDVKAAKIPKDFGSLGFTTGELDGSFFNEQMFSFNIESIDPLRYTVTGTHPELEPFSKVTVDQDWNWTEVERDPTK